MTVSRFTDLAHEEIPKPSDGCNDTQPMWIGETVYLLSDRGGEFNLYSYDLKSRNVVCRTRHEGFPVESASAGAGRIIYEQAGYLHLFNPGTNDSTRLKIGVAADLAETRPRCVSNVKSIRSADISPTGKRAVLEYRGEIVIVPAKKGDPRNLTQTPGAHERSPVWSPDGKSIACFSDAAGEYALHVRPQDGQGEGRVYALKGAGFYERPVWSPDSKKLAFVDNARTLYWIDLATGAVKRVAAEPVYSPVDTLSTSWSPDSRWLAYTLTNKVGFQTISLYSLDQDRSFPLTAPNLAIFTDEGWVVENVGVAPDVEVEQDPAAVAAGKDPQLDGAIDVVIEALAKNPPPKAPQRPSFPVRVRPGSDVRAR